MNQKECSCFLNNVLWLRKHNGLSKKEMAKKLNISIKTLNKIENGELPEKLSVEIVFDLYEHFGITPKTLFETPLE